MPTIKGQVALQNVFAAYKEEESVLNGISFKAEPGETIAIVGPTGAGKTTLVRGILAGLGHSGSVKSPTYTLLEPYELTSCVVLHFDFYRIGDSRELEFIGFDELMDADAIKLVEWPERAADRLPPPDLEITLRVEDEGRRIEVEAAR